MDGRAYMILIVLAAVVVAAAAVIAFLAYRRQRRRKAAAAAWSEAEDLVREIGRGAVTVLDVRGPDEFSGPLGHIQGALNIPVAEIDGRLDELRSSAKRIAVVCRTDKRSATVQSRLREAGIAGVTVLRGGMERWNALGFETVRRQETVMPATPKGDQA
jgi:rhodanese-related sulfurtransferase